MNTLRWRLLEKAFQFVCENEERQIEPSKWALEKIFLPDGQPARIAPLFLLLEDEKAQIRNEGIEVNEDDLASLPANHVSGLGLPNLMPFRLVLEGEGAITSPQFRFHYWFTHPDTRPVANPRRVGAILTVADQDYLIPQPQLTLIKEMDSFNLKFGQDIQDKFSIWGRLKELLPADCLQDEYLKRVDVFRADAFSLNPRINSMGEIDFDPVLLRTHPNSASGTQAEGGTFENALPPAAQETFASSFRKRLAAQSNYPLGHGQYCLLSPEVKKTLSVVRVMADQPKTIRREFLANPRGVLKEMLRDELPEDVIEGLFRETAEYSARVLDIGIWKPPIIPFLKKATQPWLPPEALGIQFGPRSLQLSLEELSAIVEKMREALDRGLDSIDHQGTILPVSEPNLRTLEKLQQSARPSDQESDELGKDIPAEDSPPEIPEVPADPIALLIARHLESMEANLVPRKPPVSTVEFEVEGLLSTLLPHQLEGLRWLQDHWLIGSRGALLADDMGLGKTFQALAFLRWVRNQMASGIRKTEPILLVAPTGLLKNWEAEIETHLGRLGLGESFSAYGSSLREIREAKSEKGSESEIGIPRLDRERLATFDLVLTTYETLRDYQLSFGAIHWAVGVFDEAQKVKNPAVRVTDAAKAMNLDFVITLTGTPVENRLADLWSIGDLTQPGSLLTLKEFCKRYDSSDDHQGDALIALKRVLTEDTKPPLMLRRMKEDHLKGLPEKRLHLIKQTMPDVQANAYQGVVRNALEARGAPKMILEALHGLRSISLHPFQRQEQTDDEYISQSARLQTLFQILDDISDHQEKALVFLESLEMHATLAELIQRRYHLESPPLIINGTVNGESRKKRVDVFQKRSGFDVMLLSPRAGGVGLTLHAANHVIHLSRWWNPAVEDQCTDRVYRIGQNRTVHVYIPLALHPSYPEESFDMKLHSLLEKKRELSRTLLLPPASSDEDVETLFREVTEVECGVFND